MKNKGESYVNMRFLSNSPATKDGYAVFWEKTLVKTARILIMSALEKIDIYYDCNARFNHMRRLTRSAFTTVSLAALLSLISVHSYAVQPAVQILGVLKQKDQWQVGTVDNQGDKYCAMVGNFDQASVLAFARNPAGFGSLAIEFRDDLFTKGKDYEVQLAVETGIPMTFTGKASNARSLVIQIGQDSAVYNALSTSKTLRFSSSAIDAKFSLTKFTNNYKKLVNCATDLTPVDPDVPQMAAVKVDDVEAVEMADARLAAAVKAEERTPAATRAAKAEEPLTVNEGAAPQTENKSLLGKFFGKFKGKDDDSVPTAEQPTETAALTGTADTDSGAKKKSALVAEAEIPVKPLPKPAAAPKTAKAAEEAVEGAVQDVKAEVKTAEAAPAEAPAAEVQTAETLPESSKPVVERKLLAAVNGGGLTAPALPEKAGLSAREMEAQQTAVLQKAIHAKENEIAVLAAVRAQAARDEFAVAELQQKIYSRKTGEVLLEKEILEKQAAEEAKTVKEAGLKADQATLVAAKADAEVLEAKRLATLKQKDEELAKLEAEKTASDKALAGKLAKMQASFDAEKAALEAERDSLKQKLAAQSATETALPEKTAALAAGQKRIQDLEQKLGGAEASRRELGKTLADLETQNRRLQADLKQKEQALKDTSADVLALARQQKDMAALQKQLTEKSLQSAALEESLTAEKAKTSAALAAAVGEKETALDTLEARLSEAESARKLEAERAAKLEAARIEAEKKVAALEASLAEAKVKAEAETAAAAAAAAAQAAAEAEARLKAEMAAAQEKAEAEAALRAEKLAKERQAALEAQAVREKKELAAAKKELAAANEKALMQAETEIALLKEEKERLQKQLADKTATARITQADAPRSAAALKSVAVATPAPKPVAGTSGKPLAVAARIPGTDVALAVSKIEPAAGAVEVEVFDPPVTAMPVVPMRPVAHMPAQAFAPGQHAVAVNRAESFLDGIMKHHVPAGTAPAIGKSQVPPSTPAAALQPPVAPVLASAQKPALMPTATPLAGSEMKDISLETLLNRAGVRGAVFMPATTPGIRQWSLGSINGMYEELPATRGAFDRAVAKYISRYEHDCPQKLSVQMGRPQKTAAGLTAQGSMHCDMPGNAYSTSMIFVEDADTFGALLHSGQPADLAQVKSLGDNLFYALSASGGIAAAAAPVPQVRTANDFPPPVTEQPAMRFNLRGAAPQQADEFETVVVQ